MQIQSIAPNLVSSLSNASPQGRQASSIPPASTGAATANISTTVTISQAARDLAAQSSGNPSLHYQEVMLRDAERDPAFAAKAARDFAYDRSYEMSGPLVDISAYPVVRYAATGEVVTESGLAAFKAEAAKVTSGRIALYDAEKARGTPDAEILQKLFRYMDSQSENYRSKIAWARAPQ